MTKIQHNTQCLIESFSLKIYSKYSLWYRIFYISGLIIYSTVMAIFHGCQGSFIHDSRCHCTQSILNKYIPILGESSSSEVRTPCFLALYLWVILSPSCCMQDPLTITSNQDIFQYFLEILKLKLQNFLENLETLPSHYGMHYNDCGMFTLFKGNFITCNNAIYYLNHNLFLIFLL